VYLAIKKMLQVTEISTNFRACQNTSKANNPHPSFSSSCCLCGKDWRHPWGHLPQCQYL